MKKIVIFASGSGSNAEKIMVHFKNNDQANVVTVFSNNLNAKVLDKAKNYQVNTQIFKKEDLYNDIILKKLNEIKPDLIVLAGFLLKLPPSIIENFPNKIINIHPALLPKYGGKGMYGINVHQSVLENKEPESGITIHFVNEHYDEGDYIFQKSISIKDCKSAEEIAEKVLELEHYYYKIEIEKLLTSNT